jgi:transcriptional regulator with PAS, ATPase and Fis domain
MKVDVRVIAAYKQRFDENGVRGQFREDLYYRLNVIPIHLPPLRGARKTCRCWFALPEKFSGRNPVRL